MPALRILVVGAGSTGGYFGGRLAAAGRDVTFLVRPGRAAQLRDGGLHIVSPHGNLDLAPAVLTADEITGPFDIVLLTVKAYSLPAALDDIAPAVGPGTMVLPFLNGMGHMDALADRFGPGPLVGCTCKVATTLDEAGRIHQLSDFQELAYGERDGSASDRMTRLDAVLQGAGFAARLTPTIEREMWEKWIMLATLGGATCLLRGNVGEIVRALGGRAVIGGMLDECTAIATAAGHAPGEAFLANARSLFSDAQSRLTASMYRDLMGDGPVEADQILGDFIARGDTLGTPASLLSAAYAQLSIYQAHRASVSV